MTARKVTPISEADMDDLVIDPPVFYSRKANEVFCRGVERIWQCCRANAHSLDSERHTKVIQDEIDTVTRDLRQTIDAYEVQLKEKRKEVRDLTKRNATHRDRIDELKKELEDLKDTFRPLVTAAVIPDKAPPEHPDAKE